MFYRSSHLRCSLKTMFLLISPNLQENTCAGVFFKVAALKACYFINFIKKVTPALMFSCEFCETFKNTFSENICERLLLLIIYWKAGKASKYLSPYPKGDFLLHWYHDFSGFYLPLTDQHWSWLVNSQHLKSLINN